MFIIREPEGDVVHLAGTSSYVRICTKLFQYFPTCSKSKNDQL